jgi:hypothetical protein
MPRFPFGRRPATSEEDAVAKGFQTMDDDDVSCMTSSVVAPTTNLRKSSRGSSASSRASIDGVEDGATSSMEQPITPVRKSKFGKTSADFVKASPRSESPSSRSPRISPSSGDDSNIVKTSPRISPKTRRNLTSRLVRSFSPRKLRSKSDQPRDNGVDGNPDDSSTTLDHSATTLQVANLGNSKKSMLGNSVPNESNSPTSSLLSSKKISTMTPGESTDERATSGRFPRRGSHLSSLATSLLGLSNEDDEQEEDENDVNDDDPIPLASSKKLLDRLNGKSFVSQTVGNRRNLLVKAPSGEIDVDYTSSHDVSESECNLDYRNREDQSDNNVDHDDDTSILDVLPRSNNKALAHNSHSDKSRVDSKSSKNNAHHKVSPRDANRISSDATKETPVPRKSKTGVSGDRLGETEAREPTRGSSTPRRRKSSRESDLNTNDLRTDVDLVSVTPTKSKVSSPTKVYISASDDSGKMERYLARIRERKEHTSGEPSSAQSVTSYRGSSTKAGSNQKRISRDNIRSIHVELEAQKNSEALPQSVIDPLTERNTPETPKRSNPLSMVDLDDLTEANTPTLTPKSPSSSGVNTNRSTPSRRRGSKHKIKSSREHDECDASGGDDSLPNATLRSSLSGGVDVSDYSPNSPTSNSRRSRTPTSTVTDTTQNKRGSTSHGSSLLSPRRSARTSVRTIPWPQSSGGSTLSAEKVVKMLEDMAAGKAARVAAMNNETQQSVTLDEVDERQEIVVGPGRQKRVPRRPSLLLSSEEMLDASNNVEGDSRSFTNKSSTAKESSQAKFSQVMDDIRKSRKSLSSTPSKAQRLSDPAKGSLLESSLTSPASNENDRKGDSVATERIRNHGKNETKRSSKRIDGDEITIGEHSDEVDRPVNTVARCTGSRQRIKMLKESALRDQSESDDQRSRSTSRSKRSSRTAKIVEGFESESRSRKASSLQSRLKEQGDPKNINGDDITVQTLSRDLNRSASRSKHSKTKDHLIDGSEQAKDGSYSKSRATCKTTHDMGKEMENAKSIDLLHSYSACGVDSDKSLVQRLRNSLQDSAIETAKMGKSLDDDESTVASARNRHKSASPRRRVPKSFSDDGHNPLLEYQLNSQGRKSKSSNDVFTDVVSLKKLARKSKRRDDDGESVVVAQLQIPSSDGCVDPKLSVRYHDVQSVYGMK